MKEFDIEFLQLSLKQNINLLKCFDEFCDEGVIPEQATRQEKNQISYCFTSRLESHRSILELSIRNLEEHCDMIEDFLSNKSKGGVQNVR